MPSRAEEFHRLVLMVERLLDAELLLAQEGAALLAQAEAACRFQKAGDAENARQHVEQLARIAEALVLCGALDLENGRAVIETARQILADQTDPLA